MSKKSYTIGIDIGGTKILVAAFDARFRIQSEIKMKTRPDKGLSHFLDEIYDSVKQVMAEARIKRSDILGAGVGCPGMIDSERGVITASPNISFLRNQPLARLLARRVYRCAVMEFWSRPPSNVTPERRSPTLLKPATRIVR